MSHESYGEISGAPVVTTREGAILGKVTTLYVDADARRLAGIACRRRWHDDEVNLPIESIELVGRDVVLVRSEEDVDGAGVIGGQRVKRLDELYKMEVATTSGRKLGRLRDLELDDEAHIVGLHVDEGSFDVDRDKLELGEDLIIVPEDIEIDTSDSHRGLLARFFAPHPIDAPAPPIETP